MTYAEFAASHPGLSPDLSPDFVAATLRMAEVVRSAVIPFWVWEVVRDDGRTEIWTGTLSPPQMNCAECYSRWACAHTTRIANRDGMRVKVTLVARAEGTPWADAHVWTEKRGFQAAVAALGLRSIHERVEDRP